ncbi:MAG: signal peptidase II [bacterium]
MLFSFGVVLFDQLSKLIVKYFFNLGVSHNIIGDVVRLTYIENPGMAFGIQIGGQTFFTVFATLATIIIFIYIVRTRDEKMPLRFSLALILGGAIGNLIDRFLYGKVIDFVDIGIGNTRWPIFNVADSAVTVGMIILVTVMLFDKSHKEQEEDNELTAEKEAYP